MASPPGRNDPCSCGSGRKFKHCCLNQQAATAAAPATPVPPRDLMAAFSLFQSGQIDAGWTATQKLLRLSPRNPDVLHLQALLLRARGEPAAALAAIETAVAQAPGNDSIHVTHGLLLQQLGRLAEAGASLRRAVAINPHAPAAQSNLGGVLLALGELPAARQAYGLALAAAPGFVPALQGRAACALAAGQPEAALVDLQQAVALQPGLADSWNSLGNACWQLHRLDEARSHYAAALRCAPGHVDALDNLVTVLLNANDCAGALAVLDEGLARQPSLQRRIRRALLLPQVPASMADLLHWRSRLETELEALFLLPDRADKVHLDLHSPSLFNLAFHGLEDRLLLQRVAACYRQLVPGLNFQAEHVAQPRPAGRPLRLAWFSTHVNDHPVAHSFVALLTALAAQTGFELTMISTAARNDAGVHPGYAALPTAWLQVPLDVEQARERIAALELDVLVYLDIGMDALPYFLAFARLARLQCVVGGHPDTTGLDTIDRYLSSALAEPEGAAAHYTERLDLLTIGPFSFSQPQLPVPMKDRRALGLPTQGAIYLCPMMLQKIHPEFDRALGAVLQADPTGHVVLFEHPHAPWRAALEQRFDATVAATQRSRLIFLPWIRDAADFIAVNACASVVLDPFHFGIGTTAISVFAVGTPLVTWPGRQMRGRVGLSYCRLLELPECIASDTDDYVHRAVRIAGDPALRSELTARIRLHSPRLYDNPQAQEEFCAYFQRLALEMAGQLVPTPA